MSITLLACEMSPVVWYFEHSLALPFFGISLRTSLVAQMVKHLFTMWETWVLSLGWKDSLEKEMATHFGTLSWKIPWMEEPNAGYCPWGHKELDTTE